MTLPRNTVTGALQKRFQRRRIDWIQAVPQVWAAGSPAASTSLKVTYTEHRKEGVIIMMVLWGNLEISLKTTWYPKGPLKKETNAGSSSVSSRAFSVSKLSSSANCSPPTWFSNGSSLKKTFHTHNADEHCALIESNHCQWWWSAH